MLNMWSCGLILICRISRMNFLPFRLSGQQEQEVARAVHQPQPGHVEQLRQLAQEAVHPVPVRLRVQDGEGRGAAGGRQRQRRWRGQQEAGQDPTAVAW